MVIAIVVDYAAFLATVAPGHCLAHGLAIYTHILCIQHTPRVVWKQIFLNVFPPNYLNLCHKNLSLNICFAKMLLKFFLQHL